jgi:hypothetical protein
MTRFGLLSVIATVGLVYSPVAATGEVLFSAVGPFQPSYGTSIGTVDIRESMHYEFDIEIHSFPLTTKWSNILSIDTRKPILQMDEEFNFIVAFQGTEGKVLRTIGDGMLEAGKTYHLEFDWDQDWIRGTIDGVVVMDEASGAHDVAEDKTIYISHPSGGWGEADVSVSNILISEPSTTAAPTAAPTTEVLFSADGPFQPSQGTCVGTVDIRDTMHYEFDIEIHSFPLTTKWSNILSIDYKMPIIHLDEQFNFHVTFQQYNGAKLLRTIGDGVLEAGKTYHLEFDLGQDWIVGTMNGVVVIDEAIVSHSVMEDQTIYISNPSGGWGEADVSVSNILISEPAAADPTTDPTTTTSSVSGAHYVAIGNTAHIGKMDGGVESYCQNDEDNQAAYFSTKHDYDIGVGCCSEDGSTGYRPDCNAHPATYQEAVDLCTANGHRLCTLQEMLSGKTKGKGCWYDAAYNWVSDECQSTVSANAAAAVSGGAAIAEEANETTSADNGFRDWMTTVIGALIGVVVIGAVVVFLMLMASKRKRAAEEEETEMSKAVPEHVVQVPVPEMSTSSVAVPATTNGAAVEV